MARPSRPWYRANRGMWYTTKDGKQIPLGVTDPKDEAAALAALQALFDTEALKRLVATGQAEPAKPKTVADIVSSFLTDASSRVKPVTLNGYRRYLTAFAAKFGTVSVPELTAERIESDSRRSTWSPTTRNNYLGTIETCLRWAGVQLGRSLKKPAKESAGATSVIPEPVFRRMLAHATGDWYSIILFLWHTGCRPGEAASVAAEMVDWNARVVRLKDHKTRGTSNADRLIYLNDEALEVLQWQFDRHGKGLLFRSHTGGRLTPMAFVHKFTRLSKRIGRRVTAYGMRHTFCTRALAAGESDTVVAALVGHASTEMIHKHYKHVSEMGRALRDAAARIGKAG